MSGNVDKEAGMACGDLMKKRIKNINNGTVPKTLK
jgi:hypothetical protein